MFYKQGGIMAWDVEKAVKFLQDHAQSLQDYIATPKHRCAAAVADAIAAGGIAIVRTTHAKNFGPRLVEAGFAELEADWIMDVGGVMQGDIAVIQPYNGGTSGHMQMYGGTQWISDFKQNSSEFYPGYEYRTDKPPYKFYRYWELIPE
jgi:hypothetical protein